VDTPRDVRGFAVKFYTQEGNWDLVGNNIPVFFIQDAIKFPDLIHAVKMEADKGYPQAASAHDTFWDFVSLMPETIHMIMWAMSDRAIPRSLRFMEGFGIHTFRLVNSDGHSKLVKFHWKPVQGLQSTCWDEAVKIAGADPDYHRRDLYEAIERGDFPAWDLGVQVFEEDWAQTLPYDVLDATKLIPEEVVPLRIIGRMTLNRNPDNFFAETEQVAYCPANIVPGIDFTADPLLQGRLFSYLDTQKSRLGTANFHQIPINAPKCPFHNFQRDGMMQMQVPKGRANYEPNSLNEAGRKQVRANVRLPALPPFPATSNPMTPTRGCACAPNFSLIITVRHVCSTAPRHRPNRRIWPVRSCLNSRRSPWRPYAAASFHGCAMWTRIWRNAWQPALPCPCPRPARRRANRSRWSRPLPFQSLDADSRHSRAERWPSSLPKGRTWRQSRH
jgi:catalase